MSDPDERQEPERHVKSIPVAEFEGEFVRVMEGKLPAITLDMPEGYGRGTHLMLNVEARVRHVSYIEDRKGDLTRQHTFALEEVRLLEAFDPEHRPTNVGGSMSSTEGESWMPAFMAFLEGEEDVLDFDGEEIPDRLRDILKVYFEKESQSDDRPDVSWEADF